MAQRPVWANPPPPPTALGHYRQLAPAAGIHVSPLQLGGLNIGDQWHKFGLGEMSKESSFKLLDAYYDGGGNFIDTANFYQDGGSEMFIGEWAEERGNRDQLVIATKDSRLTLQYKYTGNYKQRDDSVKQKVHYVGNNLKSMRLSIDQSLQNLRTKYIDLFYVHLWTWETSIEELMHGLHHLVAQGKVLYLGISDTPAWIVSKANQYAKCHGLTPFVVYQGEWSLIQRSFEREIIPMARAEGMALAPWGVLAFGKFRTDAQEEERIKSGENGRTLFFPEWKRNEAERAASLALEKVAKEVGATSITSVAIAYVMHKAPFVFPIIGGRKVEHLQQNIEALELSLSDEQIKFLESVSPIDLGFPHDMIGPHNQLSFTLAQGGVTDRVADPSPIRPTQSNL
ncbi:aryl-alcohol dehydrogenase [Coprinopsis marcescibilis]|uniref:Aryl-alcohol dehydrogenase n=1 Tax=Coprinopsis marcescibilis TaxID=230819 RepID=A0A5C3L1K1_COPMA|nr:aryl-alcohol dehydrogenase [Coprinopsis marcescibilis]